MEESIQAAQVGALFLELLDNHTAASVCGCYSKSAAFQIKNTACIITTSPGGMPFGLTLDGDQEIIRRLEIHDLVEFYEDRIAFPSKKLVIDFKNAIVWDGKAALKTIIIRKRGIKNRAAWLIAWLYDQGKSLRGSSQDLCRERRIPLHGNFFLPLQTAVQEFRESLASGSIQNTFTSIGELLGLGPGLTPSGDDYLVGYLLTMWAVQKYLPLVEKKRTLISTIIQEEAPQRTNIFSWSYLQAACQGHGPQIVVNTIQSLLENRVELPSVVHRLSQIGGSSGFDLINGICDSIQDTLT